MKEVITENELKKCTNQTSLELSDRNITDEHAEVISGSVHIFFLDLWLNRITDNGAKLLASNTKLLSLNLGRNNISPKAMDYFLRNNTLRYLILDGNMLNKEQLEKVKTKIENNRKMIPIVVRCLIIIKRENIDTSPIQHIYDKIRRRVPYSF